MWITQKINHHFSFDEINLIELPLVFYGQKGNEIPSKRTYNISYWNKLTGRLAYGHVTIYSIEHSGKILPGILPEDEDVLLALLSLSYERRFVSKVVLVENMSDLLDRLSWPKSGYYYAKIHECLTRLSKILIETDCFFNKALNVYESRKFHLIDLLVTERKDAFSKKEILEVHWSDTLWISISSGNIKPLDWPFYRSIEYAPAKKLYRILDKKLYKKQMIKISLPELAINMMGYSQYLSNKKLLREVLLASEELKKKAYLEGYHFDVNDGYVNMYFIKRLKSQDVSV